MSVSQNMTYKSWQMQKYLLLLISTLYINKEQSYFYNKAKNMENNIFQHTNICKQVIATTINRDHLLVDSSW